MPDPNPCGAYHPERVDVRCERQQGHGSRHACWDFMRNQTHEWTGSPVRCQSEYASEHGTTYQCDRPEDHQGVCWAGAGIDCFQWYDNRRQGTWPGHGNGLADQEPMRVFGIPVHVDPSLGESVLTTTTEGRSTAPRLSVSPEVYRELQRMRPEDLAGSPTMENLREIVLRAQQQAREPRRYSDADVARWLDVPAYLADGWEYEQARRQARSAWSERATETSPVWAMDSAAPVPDDSTTPQRVAETERTENMRTCTRCQQRLSTDSFRWQPTRGSFHRWCRECERASQREAAARRGTGNRASRRSVSRETTTGRAFGVELELTGPSRDVIVNALSAEGIRVVARGYGHTDGDRWELKTDGSVSGYGLELVSPKLYGTEGLAELERAMRALRSVNATVDRSCGVHVHVDFRGKTLPQIKRALMPIVERQATLLAMNAPSRSTNSYVPQWSSQDVRSFASATNLRELSYLPRGVVNTQSYSRHGSIEFRSHGGSTHYGRVSAWVRMLLAAVEFGTAGSLPSDVRGFCGALGLSAQDTAHLSRFVDAAANQEASEYAPERAMLTEQDVAQIASLGTMLETAQAEIARLAALVSAR